MKSAAAIVATTVLFFLGAVGALAYQAVHYPETPRVVVALPASMQQPPEVRIVVEKGTPLNEIARRLFARDLIDHPSWFRFYANERGLSQKIKAGQYTFRSSMSPREILDRLVEGVPIEEAIVTIPEGKNLVQVAELFEEAGITSKDDMLKLSRDPAFVRQLGATVVGGGAGGVTLEGALFPDTYRFRPGTPANKVLATLVKHARQVFDQTISEHHKGAEMLNRLYRFGEREILIMASLVEKETARPEERSRIAGIFLNRLRLPTFVPHRLETDPTIVYGCSVPLEKSGACKKFEGRIRRIHLEDKENPYNTYTHEGLPPGPICNPGKKSLEAVLQPDETAYLYFVSRNDGTHYFSKTRSEHEAAVQKYQREGHVGD